MSNLKLVQARHKTERNNLASAQKAEKIRTTNYWKGELKTIQLQKKNALERLTTGSGWSQKSAAQKSAEKGAFVRSFDSNILVVKASTKTAKALLSAQHKAAKSAMASRHKSELAAAKAK